MAGPEGVRQPGVHDLPRELALDLIRTGQAERVDKDGETVDAAPKEEERVEEAVDQQAEKRETATGTGQRRRRKKVG